MKAEMRLACGQCPYYWTTHHARARAVRRSGPRIGDPVLLCEPGQKPAPVERHSQTGLPDHLMRLEEECRGDGEAKGLGRLQVDDQFELRGLLYWQVARLCPFQDLVH